MRKGGGTASTTWACSSGRLGSARPRIGADHAESGMQRTAELTRERGPSEEDAANRVMETWLQELLPVMKPQTRRKNYPCNRPWTPIGL
jgi:hypothetical protein